MWKLSKENLNLPEVKGKSGIYRFFCKDHSYVGSAKNFKHRLNIHINTMKKGTHHNHTVQNCFNKYGLDEFSFEIIEYCDEDQLLIRETYYIQLLKPDMNHILDAIRIVKDQETIERTRLSQIKYYETHRPVNIKTVYQYDLNGNYIKSFESLTDAAKETGRKNPNDICACCNGRAKTARKFRWSFEKVDKLPELEKNIRGSKIYQLDKNRNLIQIWNKLSDITECLKITSQTINKYIKSQTLYRNCYWTKDSPENLVSNYNRNPILDQPKNLLNTSASIPVYQYSLEGNFIKEYPSASEADRQMGAISKGAVAAAARIGTKAKTAFGYQWSYEKYNKISPYINNSSKAKIISVFIYDAINDKYYNYESIAEAVRNIVKNIQNFDSLCATISSNCKSGGFFKQQYLCSYTNQFKLTSRKTVIIDLSTNETFANIKEFSQTKNISNYTAKQWINNPDTSFCYLADCARVKLSESGKLLEKGQS